LRPRAAGRLPPPFFFAGAERFGDDLREALFFAPPFDADFREPALFFEVAFFIGFGELFFAELFFVELDFDALDFDALLLAAFVPVDLLMPPPADFVALLPRDAVEPLERLAELVEEGDAEADEAGAES